VSEQADPIPIDLRQAFHEILWHFKAWRPPLPEIEVSIAGRYEPMSAVCGLAGKYTDVLPIEAQEQLLSALRAQEPDRALDTERPVLLGEIARLMRSERERLNIRELEAKLAVECTYKTAGACLLELIENQRARYLARIRSKPAYPHLSPPRS
jgi:hypothetical protein